MKPLTPRMLTGPGLVESVIVGFEVGAHSEVKRDILRDGISSLGLRIMTFEPEPGISCLLAADTSSALNETRYNALWGAHSVAVRCVFDGRSNSDVMAGHGSIPYRDLCYSDYLEVVEIIPYSDPDVRANDMRVKFEFESLLKAYEESKSDGAKPDYILIDGSIYTNKRGLNAKSEYPDAEDAKEAFERILGLGGVVGMVEDSHATDVASKLGYNFTNMLLFDLALEPGEYVLDVREGVNICYIKMPSKRVPYLPQGYSSPQVVRWEFNYDGFEGDLMRLAGIWLSEDDLMHPQIYPLRMADYLSRKVKVGGLLDEIVQRKDLPLKFRQLRVG